MRYSSNNYYKSKVMISTVTAKTSNRNSNNKHSTTKNMIKHIHLFIAASG